MIRQKDQDFLDQTIVEDAERKAMAALAMFFSSGQHRGSDGWPSADPRSCILLNMKPTPPCKLSTILNTYALAEIIFLLIFPTEFVLRRSSTTGTTS